MKKMTTVWLLLMLALAGVHLIANPASAGDGIGKEWLATGTVTRTTPSSIFLLGKDNIIYRIDTGSARVLFNSKPGLLQDIRVGDKVRVYGMKTGAKNVTAVQLNVLAAAAPVQPAPVPQEQTVPCVECQPAVPQAPAVPESVEPEVGRGPAPAEPSFTGRGLVKDLHLTEGWITMLTSDGPLTIDIDSAQVFTKGVNATRADISSGDAIYVIGDYAATGKITARRVDILSTKSGAESAKPVTAVSEVGTITSLDYTAMTFVIDTATSGSVFVMVDDKTNMLSVAGDAMPFTGLKPGTKVKVSGVGSLGTGFLANQVVVIGAPR